MPVSIVIATRNRHKFRELKGLLAVRGIRWYALSHFPRLRQVQERGRTFEANAISKATAVAKATGLLALADDSGLEVAALRGAPGVRSARFAGRQGADEANNTKLLRALAGRSGAERRARYRCSLALVEPRGLIALAKGTWTGRIATRAAGRTGFGYDPLFVVPRTGKTVGQLPSRIKQRLSHRACAARRLRPVLQRLVKTRQARRRLH